MIQYCNSIFIDIFNSPDMFGLHSNTQPSALQDTQKAVLLPFPNAILKYCLNHASLSLLIKPAGRQLYSKGKSALHCFCFVSCGVSISIAPIVFLRSLRVALGRSVYHRPLIELYFNECQQSSISLLVDLWHRAVRLSSVDHVLRY